MSQPTIDLGCPTGPHGRGPAFNGIEEEAASGDTHDFTDRLDGSKPMEITVGEETAERRGRRP